MRRAKSVVKNWQAYETTRSRCSQENDLYLTPTGPCFDTEKEVVNWIIENGYVYSDYIILSVYHVKCEDEEEDFANAP